MKFQTVSRHAHPETPYKSPMSLNCTTAVCGLDFMITIMVVLKKEEEYLLPGM